MTLQGLLSEIKSYMERNFKIKETPSDFNFLTPEEKIESLGILISSSEMVKITKKKCTEK